MRRGGCLGQNNKWRNRGTLDTAIVTVVMLLATLPFLAGSTLGKVKIPTGFSVRALDISTQLLSNCSLENQRSCREVCFPYIHRSGTMRS